jgi:hypothetical protein
MVDSGKSSCEKPNSHRTEKSGKIVTLSSVNNREKCVPGMVLKCENFSNAKCGISNDITISVVTLRKLVQWKNYGVTLLTGINLIVKLNVSRINSSVNVANLKNGLLKSDCEKGFKCKKGMLVQWKNYGVTLLTGVNLIVKLNVLKINSSVNVANLKNGLLKYDCEKGFKCKKGMFLNFREIVDICTLLKEQKRKRGLRFKGTVAQESRRRFLLYNCEQKGMVLGEIFCGNITGESSKINNV